MNELYLVRFFFCGMRFEGQVALTKETADKMADALRERLGGHITVYVEPREGERVALEDLGGDDLEEAERVFWRELHRGGGGQAR